MEPSKVKIIGIAGGSGSGKTTLAREIVKVFKSDCCTVLSQDHYYLDQSAKFDGDGGSVNFDHPSSLDFNLLSENLIVLKSGEAAQIPEYDFKTHKRLAKPTRLRSKDIIVVEGTLLLSQPKIQKSLDIKIYIDVPEPLRLERRLKRDIEERGREPDGVRKQFMNQVKPMHDEYVEPTKIFADIIVRNDDYTACIEKLKKLVKK